MSFVVDFFTRYAIHLVITVCSFIMLARDNAFTARDKKHFRAILIYNLLFLICGYMDLQIKSNSFSDVMLPLHVAVRTCTTAFDYVFKTLILFYLVLGVFKPKPRDSVLIGIPAVFNTMVALLSIKTQWVFRFTPDNAYQSGPLKGVFMAIVYGYFGSLILLLIVQWNNKNTNERIAICEIVAVNSIAALLGTLGISGDDLLQLAITISVLLYFLLITVDRSNELMAMQKQQIEQQEISLMISQIQPHFLYNTLSTVCGLCREDPLLAESTLVDFSHYLRNNLDISQSPELLIPIEKELDHTTLYTNIEKTRFSPLNVEYDVTDGGFSLPFLTIQPMVENAIRHGVRSLPNGLVRITVKRDFDPLGLAVHKIVIADNGTGKSIAGNLGEHKGIGIANVKSRIEKLCHGTFDIRFTDSGTTVTICIPVFA